LAASRSSLGSGMQSASCSMATFLDLGWMGGRGFGGAWAGSISMDRKRPFFVSSGYLRTYLGVRWNSVTHSALSTHHHRPQRQLCCAFTQAVAAAAAAHHSGLWQGTVAAVADNRSSFVVVALIRRCRPNLPLQLQLLSCVAVSPPML
jgi:hypothetical protein